MYSIPLRRAAIGYGMRALRSGSPYFGAAVNGYRKFKKYTKFIAPYAAAAGGIYSMFPKRSRSSQPLIRGGKKTVRVKRGYVKSSNDGHGITGSSFKRTLKKQDPALKEALPEVYRQTGQKIIPVGEGTQAFAEVADSWTGVELRQYAAYTTNTLTRMYVQSSEIRCVYTNVTSTPVKLTLYDCKAKSMGQLDIDNPFSAIKQGLQTKYNNVNQFAVPYQTPKESEHFRKFWKIINEKTITLNPGEVHEHFLETDVSKYFENQDGTSVSANGATTVQFHYIPPFTTVHFCRIIGTPVTDDTNVSTATSKVICMIYKKLVLKRPQGQAGIQLLASQLSTPPSNLTTEKTINQDTMAPVANVTA